MTVTVVVSLQLTMESYSLFMILITKFFNEMFFVFNISTFASYGHCIFILPWTFVVLYVYIFFMSYFILHLYYQDKMHCNNFTVATKEISYIVREISVIHNVGTLLLQNSYRHKFHLHM